jgi:hypothetical protein
MEQVSTCLNLCGTPSPNPGQEGKRSDLPLSTPSQLISEFP